MRLGVAVAVACLSMTGHSMADQADQQTASSSRPTKESDAPTQMQGNEKITEIIVTATKRQMSLKDVPFGLSAMTEDDLARMGATGAEQYLAEIPGVHYTANGRGRSPIVIRGISTDGKILSNLQKTVEIYLDDLPLLDRFSTWTTPDIDTFDVERVEVLRGPQGTLFGSGALGGAVRLITNKPNLSTVQGRVELGSAFTDGGEDGSSIRAMINVPLVPDRLALRAVAYRQSVGGYVDNVFRGENNVDGGNVTGGRLILAYQPTDTLKFRVTAMRQRDVLDDGSAVFQTSQQGGRYEFDGFLPEESDAKLTIVNFNMDYDFGPATVTSTTTYGKRDSFFQSDFERYLAAIVATDPDPNDADYIRHDTKRFAQELRLTSEAGPLEWSLGGFFMDYKQDTAQVWNLVNANLLLLDINVLSRVKELAVFGEVTFRFGERLSVTAGARWFDNEYLSETLSKGVIDQTAPTTRKKSSSTTPKVSLSFFPKEDIHLYATASRGYRIGQTNFSNGFAPEVPEGFGPDSLWNYEIGLKSDWFDHRASTNLAAFYIDWSDIQLQRVIQTSELIDAAIISNAGKAKVKGIEAEITLHPIDEIELGSSLTYTDAVLESVLSGVTLTPGSTLPGSPKFSAANYLQKTFSFSNGTPGYLRLSHQYVDNIYSDIDNSGSVESDSYHQFDARAGVDLGRYEFVAYVDNLTNNDAMLSRQTFVVRDPYGYRLRPRTIGLTFRASF